MNKKDNFGKKFLNYVKSNPIVVMLVIVAIIVGFTKDNFFSWKNFGNLMSNTAVRFLIALTCPPAVRSVWPPALPVS